MSAPVAPIRERTSPSKFQRWRAGPNSTPTAPLGPIPPTLALPTTAISDSPPLVLSVRFNPCPVTAKPGFECAPRDRGLGLADERLFGRAVLLGDFTDCPAPVGAE